MPEQKKLLQQVIRISCAGLSVKTGGRCENPAVEDAKGRVLFCLQCLKETSEGTDPPLAPLPPRWVLLRFEGPSKVVAGEKFIEMLENSGIPEVSREEENQLQSRKASAEALGINPYRFYKNKPMDGCPVFGKEGLRYVGGLPLLLEEILTSGYEIAGFHWYAKVVPVKQRWESTYALRATLVVAFVRSDFLPHQNGWCESAGLDLLAELACHGWTYAHVHANPPDVTEGGNGLLHSVTLIGKQEGQGEKSKLKLEFKGGRWAAAETEHAIKVAAELAAARGIW